jgi:hypothetical protein
MPRAGPNRGVQLAGPHGLHQVHTEAGHRTVGAIFRVAKAGQRDEPHGRPIEERRRNQIASHKAEPFAEIWRGDNRIDPVDHDVRERLAALGARLPA